MADDSSDDDIPISELMSRKESKNGKSKIPEGAAAQRTSKKDGNSKRSIPETAASSSTKKKVDAKKGASKKEGNTKTNQKKKEENGDREAPKREDKSASKERQRGSSQLQQEPKMKEEPTKEAKSEADGEDEDNVPISELVKRRAATKSRKKVVDIVSDDDEDEEDDDEDVPISELVKKKKRPAKEPKRASPKKALKRETTKKKITTNHESVFYETLRGKLVQALLRRWWYVIDWPSKEAIEKVPEENFETLPGFPGVHVCTAGHRLGEIADHRDHSKCPCFTNLITMPTKELKALVQTAFENQIAMLKKREPNSPLIADLKKDMVAAARVDEAKADSQAKTAVLEYQRNTRGRR